MSFVTEETSDPLMVFIGVSQTQIIIPTGHIQIKNRNFQGSKWEEQVTYKGKVIQLPSDWYLSFWKLDIGVESIDHCGEK